MVTWTVIGGTSILKFSDGRRFDIGTKEGANALLRGLTTNMGLFSAKMKAISKIQKKKRLNACDISTMDEFSFLAHELPTHCGEVLFREKMPHSEIQCWLAFVIERLHKMSSEPKWIHQGHWELYDQRLLGCTLCMFKHPVPVDLAIEGNFFQTLASFAKACRDPEPAFKMIVPIVLVAFASSKKYSDTISVGNMEVEGAVEVPAGIDEEPLEPQRRTVSWADIVKR